MGIRQINLPRRHGATRSSTIRGTCPGCLPQLNCDACSDRMGALSLRHGCRGPVAFVVSEDKAALFGMFRMYTTLGELAESATTFNVFLTVDEATRSAG